MGESGNRIMGWELEAVGRRCDGAIAKQNHKNEKNMQQFDKQNRPTPNSELRIPNSEFRTPKSERGSALITTLFIVLLITITLMTIISFHNAHLKFILQNHVYLQARYSAESMLHQKLHEWRLNGLPDRPSTQQEMIFGQDSATVTLSQQGAFPRAKCSAKHKSTRYLLETLLAGLPPQIMDYGIIVNPTVDELIVAGNTRLYGNVLVGKRGVKKELLDGRPYSGSRLVYGEVSRTTIDLRPQVDHQQLQEIYDGLAMERLASVDGEFDLQAFISGDSTAEGDPSERRILQITSDIIVDQPTWIRGPLTLIAANLLTISGPVMLENDVRILADGGLRLGNGVQLSTVIACAPQVVVSDCRMKNTQIFSEDGIVVQGYSTALYPTLLCLFDRSNHGEIILEDRTDIEGWVVLAEQQSVRRSSSRVLITENASVNGLVFSENRVTFAGTVKGTIITDTFYVYHSPSALTNWVIGGRLYRDQMRHPFEVPLFFRNTRPGLTTINRQSF